ncbi:hypothetical protein SEA_RAHALELUJAH_67 [Mycobacterium phage Rahalelujah]|nr:hypothetical protein SEA_RAHALELUJAH_67 [Mycobacterium phage Rahalelujah]
MKKILLALILPLVIVGLTACEGDSTTTDDTYPNGVIYVPSPGFPGAGIPVFY